MAAHTRNDQRESSERYRQLVEAERQFVSPGGHHHHEIQVAAYFKAERRGFTPGHELDDWLEAEREYEYMIAMLNIR